MSHLSQPVMIQGDREIFSEDIDHIRTILERFPSLSRYEIVYTLCETLEWLTPAGHPKIDACTKLLNRLQNDGIIRLPALQEVYSHPGPYRQSALTLCSLSDPQPDLETSLAALGPVTLIPPGDKADQSLWNEYVQRYHYLGYKKPFGYRQRYFIESGSHRLGCILISGAAKSLGARDRWGIEAGFLVEKHQGYSYEHAFAKNWNAMKGYHYLMRLANLFNTLARFSSELAGLFAQYGVRDAIGFIRETLTGPAWSDSI